jgi:nitrilase
MRLAAAQAHQAWGRPDEGAERVVDWIARAAAEGVDLLAFGETHLGGYPFELKVDRRRLAVASFSDEPEARS